MSGCRPEVDCEIAPKIRQIRNGFTIVRADRDGFETKFGSVAEYGNSDYSYYVAVEGAVFQTGLGAIDTFFIKLHSRLRLS